MMKWPVFCKCKHVNLCELFGMACSGDEGKLDLAVNHMNQLINSFRGIPSVPIYTTHINFVPAVSCWSSSLQPPRLQCSAHKDYSATGT
ncbi:Interleukin-1 receptor-associated kinase 4 [Frankliniella fusca]|uniref:Interleukin-1 receptor-associated kinase 4 n=1 Tax=Frankliniella fusca TaxID=407009 RepID=A0AAE1LF35_9NEOP|nr:Interleukin-1 receptor-associated kinase 4 [Frankliniella fusca]